jgi:hypothetical protein
MASPVLAAKEMWVTLSKEEKLKKQKGLKVNGFQKVAEMFRESPNMTWKGDVNKKVSDLLTKRYPAQWFISTDAVLFVNEERDLPEEYGIEDIEAGLAGQADGGSIYHEKPGKISLFKQFSYDMKNITSILDHEFAHQNDWTRNIILSEPQRIKLLCDATSAFSESKEFFSEYVESIKNDDKQREAYIKVTEYWAEAIEQYMTAGPENYKKTNPTEYALVKKWFDIINDIKE